MNKIKKSTDNFKVLLVYPNIQMCEMMPVCIGVLTEVLRRYQSRIHLYLVALAPIQKEILVKTKEKFRILLYRRFMIRIAEMIAKKDKAKALITGESLGQVASQTLGNIAAIESVSTIPILRPLI